MLARNPYNWTKHQPHVELPRDEQASRAARALLRGEAVVLLGGHGMGKSVFLRQLRRHLQRRTDTRVILLPGPPAPERTLGSALQELARELGVPLEDGGAGPLLRRFFASQAEVQSLVLLYDELDRYSEGGGAGTSLGRALFNHLELVRRESEFNLGICIAGGLGVFALRDVLGSGFLSRAEQLWLAPFTAGELQTLAEPFVQRNTPLSQDTLQTLQLLSGGNPALATYGLGRLWEEPAPEQRHVVEALGSFSEEHPDFIREFRRAIMRGGLSEAPRRVLELIQRGGGSVARELLLRACAVEPGAAAVDVEDALRLLRAAGLVRLEGPMPADPVRVRPIAGLLNLPAGPGRIQGTLAELLVQDLTQVLALVHAAAADFFRPGAGPAEERKGKTLVPEAVFSAVLAIGLRLLGWEAEREANSAAGRTDLKLRRADREGVALVEVKIWPRNDYAEIQRQLGGYWTHEVRAAAAVMITDQDSADWPERYRSECLAQPGLVVTQQAAAPPLRARFSVQVEGVSGTASMVDHLLLRLPR